MPERTDPVGAILRTLLNAAARAGATEIRMGAGSPRHGSKVFFRIAGEWREQMMLPKHIRAALMERLEIVREPNGDALIRLEPGEALSGHE